MGHQPHYRDTRGYAERLIASLIAQQKSEAEPRHVEAWIRVEHPTLDALSPGQFADEVKTALACIACEPLSTTERLCESLGL